MQAIKFYYTNARMNGKTCLLAGPFFDIDRAEHYIDIVSPMFIAREPTAANASFGVLEVNRFAGYGMFNPELRAAGDTECQLPD